MRKICLEAGAGYFVDQAPDRSYRRGPSRRRLMRVENNLVLAEGPHSITSRTFSTEAARLAGIKVDQQKAPSIEYDGDLGVLLLKEPTVLHDNMQALLFHGCAVFFDFDVTAPRALGEFFPLCLVREEQHLVSELCPWSAGKCRRVETFTALIGQNMVGG